MCRANAKRENLVITLRIMRKYQVRVQYDLLYNVCRPRDQEVDAVLEVVVKVFACVQLLTNERTSSYIQGRHRLAPVSVLTSACLLYERREVEDLDLIPSPEPLSFQS